MQRANKAKDRADAALKLLAWVANRSYVKKSSPVISIGEVIGARLLKFFPEIPAFFSMPFSNALVPSPVQGVFVPNCVIASRI